MAGAERRGAGQVALLAFGAAACAAPAYAPCPVDGTPPVPPAAFARCRDLLLQRYGDLAIADEQAFRLQTEWAPVADPVGERRATVYREAAADGGLVVLVELRWLSTPWFGEPGWSAPRGDAAAERVLAQELQAVLGVAPPARP